MGRTIAYCRVSSRDQIPQLQLDALHAHGYDQLFAEKESGKHGVQRPEFSRAWPPVQAKLKFSMSRTHCTPNR